MVTELGDAWGESVELRGKHHGPHPVTMRTLAVSPSKCATVGSRLSSGASTSFGQSNVSPSPPVNDVGSPTSIACAPTQAVPMTPPAVSPVSRVGTSTPLADSEDWTTVKRVADLLAENSMLKDSIQQLNERYKHVLDHSIESDTRLMQFTDQVFVASTMRRASAADCGVQCDSPSRASAADCGVQCDSPSRASAADCGVQCDSPSRASAADCGVQCDLPSECRDQRCAEIRDLVASLRTTIEVLEAEIQCLKEEGKKSASEREQKELWEVHYNEKRLPKTPKNKQCSPKVSATVAHHSGEPRKKRRSNNKQRISLPFSSIIIEGDSHTRGLTGILRRMVTCETMVGGVCKPGAKLMEATSDDSPSAGGCYVIVAGTNDVAQQYNIYRHLERRITSKLRTSRVVVSTLPHRHDLPASHKINQETVLINNYIEELCERHRGAEVLQFNNIGRGAFTQHGMHLKRNTKHLLAQELIECLRKMDSTASRETSQPPVTARGVQNNGRKTDQALESPTAPLSTALQPPAASEPRTLLYESFAEAVKCRSPVRQVGPSSTITDTTEQKNCFPLKCQKTK
ncbi:hypothetical protein J6590_070818 [Homalodisca vitripennis]|nr:hypothetical protein J6590_070818 [Homalodisca vitripennis]